MIILKELKLVIDFCIRVLSIDLNIDGYHFTLANVFIYGLFGFIILYLFLELFFNSSLPFPFLVLLPV